MVNSCNEFADSLNGVVTKMTSLTQRTKKNFLTFQNEYNTKNKIALDSKAEFDSAMEKYKKGEKEKNVCPLLT